MRHIMLTEIQHPVRPLLPKVVVCRENQTRTQPSVIVPAGDYAYPAGSSPDDAGLIARSSRAVDPHARAAQRA
ncbi:hypothetical protein FHS42_005650 [Streptomyces zagrosensis]|uniref:Uncharacterized protein n=1 Tax=Streptomyces zagrosensis TaxID=1042984 RepID=A0A7W9QE08_9ACTN|nr:hypothetical protein [Streptomyces zagrosensis]